MSAQIREKIRKLRALAQDPAAAPGEAANAKEAADRLMGQHGLKDDDIPKAEEPSAAYGFTFNEPPWSTYNPYQHIQEMVNEFYRAYSYTGNVDFDFGQTLKAEAEKRAERRRKWRVADPDSLSMEDLVQAIEIVFADYEEYKEFPLYASAPPEPMRAAARRLADLFTEFARR